MIRFFLVTFLIFSVLSARVEAQVFYSDAASVFISANGIVQCNGGATFTGSGTATNNGSLYVTKNATSAGAGNLTITSGASVQGNGDYYVEQDWINNANFLAQGSTVHLYGNTEQLITSANGTETQFNVLKLSGTGVGPDRRKTLSNVNSSVGANGQLVLNDRELYTQTFNFTVFNPSSASISNDQTFGAEGFVASDVPGYLVWSVNSSLPYLFPVGSSVGTLRYRPVVLQPVAGGANTFRVRMNNTMGDTYGYPLSQHESTLSSLNSLFFHSIEREAGSSSVDMSIAYDAGNDGGWSTIAQWRANQSMWIDLGNSDASGIGQYEAVMHAAWDFTDSSHPYVLANPDNQLIIPNVFTPNNDGVNDLYIVTAKNVTEFNLVILNRWGETVFETDDISTPWDGTWNGKPCPDGTYFYMIRAQTSSGELVKHGHVTLSSN